MLKIYSKSYQLRDMEVRIIKFITIGGAPATGKTYTSKILAEQNNFLALELESLRWDFFNDNLKENLYKYIQYGSNLKQENMREYYLKYTLYENKVPLDLFVKWHKATVKFISEKLYKIIDEIKVIKTEKDYIEFCNKYKKIINYMPDYKILNKNYVICSHAFINTMCFFEEERIKIDFTDTKRCLIKRFKKRENIKVDTFDRNLELYFKSYEEILKYNISNTLYATDRDIIKKIKDLI